MKTNFKVTDMNLPTWTVPIWYRGFRNRSGSEVSLEACKETIDELFF
jgi:hypothetical protein